MLNIVTEESTPISVLQRRKAGGREWKMQIREVLESEKSDLAKLRLLRDKAVADKDWPLLAIVMDLYEEKCLRLIALTDLLHYRSSSEQVESAASLQRMDDEKEKSNTNGSSDGNARG